VADERGEATTASPRQPVSALVTRVRSVLASLGDDRPAGRAVVIAGVVAAVGLLAGLLSWAFASPYGTTPDEDYHMISTWCPTPGQGGCEIVDTTTSGHPVIAVPGQFLSRLCYVNHPAASVACAQTMTDDRVWSARFSVGTYPGYYYHIMHVFASDDVNRMTLGIRVANCLIAAGLALALLLLMNAAARRIYVWTLAVVAIPGMAWLVGSAAPDSWSIIGVTTVWAGITGAFLATVQRRRYGLLALAVIGAFLASAARSDAAVYVMVAAVTPSILHWRRLRTAWHVPAAAAVVCGIGVAGFLSGRQATGLVADGCGVSCASTPNAHGSLHLFVNNVVYFFEWFANAWRNTSDMQQPLVTVVVMFAAFVVVVGAALLRAGMTRAKALALLVAAGVFVGAPVMSLQLGHSLLSLGQGGLQQRYLFPALVILVGVALTPALAGRGRYLSLRSTVALWGVVALAQAVYLHQWIRRCVTGMEGHGFNLNSGAEWWWASGPSPMLLWIIGSLGFAVASAAVVFVGRQAEREALDIPSMAGSSSAGTGDTRCARA